MEGNRGVRITINAIFKARKNIGKIRKKFKYIVYCIETLHFEFYQIRIKIDCTGTFITTYSVLKCNTNLPKNYFFSCITKHLYINLKFKNLQANYV